MRAAERHGRPLRPPATNLPADSGHRARHGARNASLRAQRHKSRADVAARPAEADGARRFPVPVRPKSRCWFIRASHRSTPTAAPAGSPTGSPFVGRGDAYQPLVWDEDAAALVTAAEPPNLRGTFDVVDDEPLTRTQLASALAVAVGRRRVRRLPTPVVRAALGGRMEFLLRSQRVSNRRFVEATGWNPRIADAADGLTRLPSAAGGPGRRLTTPASSHRRRP